MSILILFSDHPHVKHRNRQNFCSVLKRKPAFHWQSGRIHCRRQGGFTLVSGDMYPKFERLSILSKWTLYKIAGATIVGWILSLIKVPVDPIHDFMWLCRTVHLGALLAQPGAGAAQVRREHREQTKARGPSRATPRPLWRNERRGGTPLGRGGAGRGAAGHETHWGVMFEARIIVDRSGLRTRCADADGDLSGRTSSIPVSIRCTSTYLYWRPHLMDSEAGSVAYSTGATRPRLSRPRGKQE